MKKSFLGALLILVLFAATPTFASHAWADYHWARTTNPFTLQLGDNVSGDWDRALTTASDDWSQSTILDTIVVSGLANPKNCRATTGRIEVCNSKYGNNGWLGLASISINSAHHITSGTAKMNDTYFTTAKYNTPAWRQLVMCQEIAHIFGLDHQDEVFDNANLGTCMDYTSDPSTNQHPNQHDFDELVAIYTHHDSSTTIGTLMARAQGFLTALSVREDQGASEWGRVIGSDASGRPNVFAKDLGDGGKRITHVFWAE
jgi:hypothetical protein